jgi:hypothetical protein
MSLAKAAKIAKVETHFRMVFLAFSAFLARGDKNLGYPIVSWSHCSPFHPGFVPVVNYILYHAPNAASSRIRSMLVFGLPVCRPAHTISIETGGFYGQQ